MTDFAAGGFIQGPTDPGDDRIPVLLSPGYVHAAPEVREHFGHILDRLNQRTEPPMTEPVRAHPAVAPPLRKLRLTLARYDLDLLLVGDRFEEGGRYVQAEIARDESETWTSSDWADMYEKLARQWWRRFERESEAGR